MRKSKFESEYFFFFFFFFFSVLFIRFLFKVWDIDVSSGESRQRREVEAHKLSKQAKGNKKKKKCLTRFFF